MATELNDALHWVTGLLAELSIDYQVVGGLAARCHGATRPLVDIDLYVPDEAALEQIAAAASDRLVRPPSPHRDEHWDLTFPALEWGGWKIEVASAGGAKVWNRETERWESAAIRFEQGETVEVGGVDLRVMPKDALIRYKKGLGREVDRLDLEALQVGVSDDRR